MTKPVLFLDTNFLIHIYGQATEDKPRGINYDPKMGEAILDDLGKKYDIRVTTTVLDEATTLEEFKDIRNWFDKNKGTKAVIYETHAFGGKNGGERSIMDVITRTKDRDPTLPPAGDTENLKIATLDKLLKKSTLQDHVVSTQQVAEAALADGTLSRVNYDLLGEKTGDILRARGGFKPSEQVYAEHGITPPTAETVTPAKPSAETAETKAPVRENPAPESKPVTNAEPPAPAPPPESSPAKTAQTSKFVPEATPAETPTAPKVRPGVGNAGAAGVGLVLGAKGLHDAIESGDTVGGAIATTNIATSTAQATEGILTAAGKSAPLLTKAGKFIPGVNVGVTLVDGAYQISKEDTPEHMAERATAMAATATTAIALGTATATATEAGVITAGVTGVLGTGAAATGTAAVVAAAAPVVLTVAAVGAVAYTGEKAIEAKRAWDDVDRTIAENGAATKRQNYKSDDGKPSVLGFKHIAVMMLQHSEHMKNENMNGTGSLERNQKGRFKIEDFKKIDMRDPKNIAELERVLKDCIAKEDKIIKDNDSILPRWIRSSDSADKMTMAQMERADLVGAMQELEMYKKELKAYDAAHPDDPATTPAAGTPQKPKQKTQAPS
ncbi:MAG: hypothetical protein EPN97_18155 [Alphaproteobacteria bacterium]|nr:MAG: hypothetical protein EPN97_18155 [Alphaproteobacteria bacterium]